MLFGDHRQLLEIGTSPPAEQSDKEMVLKGYDTSEFYQDVNMLLYESQLVKRLNTDQQMIDLGLDASDLLNDSPANRSSESESQKLRDEQCRRLSRSYTILATSGVRGGAGPD